MFNLGYGEVLVIGLSAAIIVGPRGMERCAFALRDFADRVDRALLPLSFEQTLLLSLVTLGLITTLLIAAPR